MKIQSRTVAAADARRRMSTVLGRESSERRLVPRSTVASAIRPSTHLIIYRTLCGI